MYSLISRKGMYNKALQEYIVDFETDIAEVPTDAVAGSTCFVIENSTTYILNHKKQWIKVNLSSGNTPSGDEIIYEGGVL